MSLGMSKTQVQFLAETRAASSSVVEIANIGIQMGSILQHGLGPINL